jgi:hypothetical protein
MILDDEDILVNQVRDYLKSFKMIIEMIDDDEKRKELVKHLNENISFGDYVWSWFYDGIQLSIPNKWMSQLITIIRRDSKYDFFFYLPKQQNKEFESIMGSMIDALGLIEYERSKKHPEYLKREYYLPRYQI